MTPPELPTGVPTGVLYLVTGSREYPDLASVSMWAERELPPDVFLMQGEARGVDRTARDGFLRSHPEGQLLRRPPDWNRFGKRAGYLRNASMVAEALELQEAGWQVFVSAFWDGTSRGTLNTIETARASGFDVVVHQPEKPLEIWLCKT